MTTLDDGTREALSAPDSLVRLALKSAELSTAFDPKSARAWSARGLALALIPARWKESRGALDHARALAPNSPEVAWRRARALLRMGRRQEAEAGLRAALQLSPAFAPALADLGDLALGDRRTELACSWLNAAITADPYRPLSYALRAMARPGEKDVRLGWSDAEIAVRLGARTYGEAAYALVDARGGDSTRARGRIFKLFRELDRQPRIGVTDARLAALALVVVGDYPRAVSLLERAYPRDGVLSAVVDDPALAVLRGDPRFMRIVNATGTTSTGRRAGDGRVAP